MDEELLRIEALRAASRITQINIRVPGEQFVCTVAGGRSQSAVLAEVWAAEKWRPPLPTDIVAIAEEYLKFLRDEK